MTMSIPREGSTTELAVLLGLTTQSINKHAEKGLFRRTKRGRYDLGASIQAYVQYREKLAKDRSAGSEYDTARTAKMQEDAQLARMQRLEREGALLPRADVENAGNAIMTILRTKLLGIHGKVERNIRGRFPETAPEVARIVRIEVTAA